MTSSTFELTIMASMLCCTTDYNLRMNHHTLETGPVASMDSLYQNNHVTHQHKQQFTAGRGTIVSAVALTWSDRQCSHSPIEPLL